MWYQHRSQLAPTKRREQRQQDRKQRRVLDTLKHPAHAVEHVGEGGQELLQLLLLAQQVLQHVVQRRQQQAPAARPHATWQHLLRTARALRRCGEPAAKLALRGEAALRRTERTEQRGQRAQHLQLRVIQQRLDALQYAAQCLLREATVLGA